MAQFSRLAGTTSQSVNIFIQDSSSTVGAGLSGLAYNTSGLACYYSFTGANTTAVVVSLATLATVTTAFAEGGFIEIDATHQKGLYRLDLKNTSLAASKGNLVTYYLYGAANMAPVVFDIELTGWDNQDGVHGGLSSLPNTAVTTNASLLTSGTGTDQLSVASGRIDAGKILGTAISTPATAGILDINVKNIVNTAAAIDGNNFLKVDLVDIAGSAVSTSSAQLGVNVVNAGATAWASGAITSAVFAAGAVNRAALNADTGLQSIRSNTAQAGAATTITLDAGASATNSFYNNDIVYITGGTGVGQARFITAYVGSTKVATVATWATNPDSSSTFALLPFDAVAGATAPTTAQIATAVWEDLLAGGDFGTGSSIGKLLAGITFSVANQVDANVVDWKGSTAPAMTGDAFARLGAPAGASIAADLAEIEAETDGIAAIPTSNGTSQTGDSYALLTGVNTELASVPASTASLVSMIKWLYLLARNKLTQTSTTQIVKANDTSTTVGTSTVSDDGTTATRGMFS